MSEPQKHSLKDFVWVCRIEACSTESAPGAGCSKGERSPATRETSARETGEFGGAWRRAPASSLESFFTKLIVNCPLLLIAQDLEGLRDLWGGIGRRETNVMASYTTVGGLPL